MATKDKRNTIKGDKSLTKGKTNTVKRDASLPLSAEERDRLIEEFKAYIEKSLEEDRLAKEKSARLWSIPKEKMTAKERRQGIAELKASIKRGVGRRSIENYLSILINDCNR